MPSRVKMLGRVFILRVVATADVPAGPAQPEMHPGIARLQTFFATARMRAIGLDEIQVIAAAGHEAAPRARLGAGNTPRTDDIAAPLPRLRDGTNWPVASPFRAPGRGKRSA